MDGEAQGEDLPLDALRGRLSALALEKDHLKKMLLAAAIVQQALKQAGYKVYVVGGAVVEAYSRGLYMTHDIDYALSDPISQVEPTLFRLGFRREGRVFLHPEGAFVVEFPGRLDAGEMERLVTVEVDGLEVSLLSLEDIICDRINAAKHWKDESSAEWARMLMAAHRERLEFGLLGALCADTGCLDEFERLRALAEGDAGVL